MAAQRDLPGDGIVTAPRLAEPLGHRLGDAPGSWLDLDLDAAPAVRPARRRPFRTALIAAAALGAVAGAALAGSTVDAPFHPPPATGAVLILDNVALSPNPVAVLRLTLENHGRKGQVAEEVTVSGGGILPTTSRLGRSLAPDVATDSRITVPLDCPAGQTFSGTVTAVIHLRTPGLRGGATEIRAVPAGRASEIGGLCSAADAGLPSGWRTTAHATTWKLSGQDLDLVVTDLPRGVEGLVAVEADGVLLPPPRIVPGGAAGSLHLVVGPPVPGCRDGGLRPVVPTGLQLRVRTGTGLGSVYVPLGASLSKWLMDAYVRSCPSRPDGPSAVRTAYGS